MGGKTRKGKTKGTQHDYLGAFIELRTKAEDKRVVVSIDFGSTHCGVAYALTHTEDGKKPEIFAKVYRNKFTKQPTCALFDKLTKQLVSFGFEAREEYLDMVDNTDKRDNYLYFEGRSIKMRLWDSSLRTDATCETVDGNGELPLLRVVSGILGHLKEEALGLAATGTNIKIPVDDALWVLTVPSIWQEADKQFMRRAAHNAGIIKDPASSDLLLALEPECAVISARNAIGNFNLGDKILCLDCGGGTVDICAVEVTSLPKPESTTEEEKFLRLRQLLEPTGGNWGSTFIDQNFLSFLAILFDDPRLGAIREKSPSSIIEVLEEWESVKTGVDSKEFSKGTGEKSLNAAVILEVLEGMGRSTNLAELVEDYNRKCEIKNPLLGGVKVAGRKGQETNLIMPMKLVASFFRPVLDKILDEVDNILENEEMKNLNYLLLVGGFAESDILRTEIKKKVKPKNIELIVPKHAASVVQKGAVEYGLDPAIISTRRARQTIGIKVTMRIKDLPDPDNEEIAKHKFHDKNTNEFFVRDIFHVYVRKGQEIESSMVVKKNFGSQNKKSKKVKFDIYATDSDAPKFVTDPGCVRLAKIVVDVEPDSNPKLECLMRFASTEITAEIKNLDTGKEQRLLLQYDNMGLQQASGSMSTFVRVPVREIVPWGDMDFDEFAANMSEML